MQKGELMSTYRIRLKTPPAPAAVPLQPIGKVLAVTSGKGGVRQTFCSANLAAALAKLGHRVLVLDADLGLANLDGTEPVPQDHPA